MANRISKMRFCNTNTALAPKAMLLAITGMLGCLATLAVQAEVSSGQKAWLQQEMSLTDARHLAGRTGFGGSPRELAVLADLTRQEAVNHIVRGLATEPYISMPPWVEAPAPRFWARRSMDSESQQAFDTARETEINELRQWWVNNMLQTDSPQTERLVLFWHDHFATSYTGINRRSLAMARQNQLFREMGTGSYRDMLTAIVRDPAMLAYLDNQSNNKKKPNENLARELLELFTLGEGNYSETTVKEAARALTGYGFSDTANQSFQLYGYKRDEEEKTLFGVTAKHDADSLIDLILQQPAAANHLATKFWHAFVSDRKPDPQFLKTISQRFRDSDYDLKVLYSSVLSSKSFWHEDYRMSLIKSPAVLLVGTARSLDYPKSAWQQMPSLHALLGMDLFAPPNVAGWDEGVAFVAPGRLLNRQLALDSMLSFSSPNSTLTDSSSMAETNSTSMQKPEMASNDMQAMAKGADSDLFQIRMAAHHYRGVPRYQVRLLKDRASIWSSEERELAIGYDTEMFGSMRNRSMLPWQSEQFSAPQELMRAATQIEIEFLNDAAGKNGDRNLFVESVELLGQKYFSAGGKQKSHCVPKNPKQAGNLYCAGTLRININQNQTASLERTGNYSASGVTAVWLQNRRGKLNGIFALENVQTPDKFFHTLSVHLVSDRADHFQVRLFSYGCWPACIEVWPECAWRDQRSNEEISVVMPLRRGRVDHIDCHYDSLSQSEQALVRAIWASLPQILVQAKEHEYNRKQVDTLKEWTERLDSLKSAIKKSEYLVSAKKISINPEYADPVVQPTQLYNPTIEIANIDELESFLSPSGLSLVDLMLGGSDAATFPELESVRNQSFSSQLDALLDHPAYQVH